MDALSLNTVHYRWPGQSHPALIIDQWQIKRGERVFLSGASGSGKSTLLQLIAGVLKADSGELRVLQQDLCAFSQAQRDAFRATHLGFVFQMFNLLPYLSVAENVLLPTHFSTARKQRSQAQGSAQKNASKLLAALGIEALEKRAVQTLSVGQQQRVALARALIGEPELIICDEPTSAIDAPQRDAFMQLLLDQVQRTKATLLFVSHDPSLARYFDTHVQLSQINRAAQSASEAS
jgi:putative ABC transport system ATP-binding protein